MNDRAITLAAFSALTLGFGSGCLANEHPSEPTVDAGADANASDAGGADATSSTGDGATPSGDASGPNSGIYVSNYSGTVLVFPLGATGNATPSRAITGSSTGLNGSIGIAVDTSGALYVANRSGSGVTVFSAGANGNVAPTRTLTASGMLSSQALTLGSAGDVYVTTCPSCGSSGGGNMGVYHFPNGASTSDRVLGGATNTQTSFSDPSGVAIDGNGELWVSNAFGGNVEGFDASASGDVAPSSSYLPPGTSNIQTLAYGANTLFIVDPSEIVEWVPGTDGGAPTTIPIAALSLNYPGGAFVDDHDTAEPVLYVTDYSANAIVVAVLTGSAGNWSVGSVATIEGTGTQLDQPLGIAVVR